MVAQLAGAAESLEQQVDEVTSSMSLFRLSTGEGKAPMRDAVELRKRTKSRTVLLAA
jgi:hypothetical protein